MGARLRVPAFVEETSEASANRHLAIIRIEEQIAADKSHKKAVTIVRLVFMFALVWLLLGIGAFGVSWSMALSIGAFYLVSLVVASICLHQRASVPSEVERVYRESVGAGKALRLEELMGLAATWQVLNRYYQQPFTYDTCRISNPQENQLKFLEVTVEIFGELRGAKDEWFVGTCYLNPEDSDPIELKLTRGDVTSSAGFTSRERNYLQSAVSNCIKKYR